MSFQSESPVALGNDETNRPVCRIRWQAPVIVMVLAATAVPVELRSPGSVVPEFRVDFFDVLQNVGGYIPVGIVLGWLGPMRAALTAAAMSLFAEMSQFGMAHRDPSIIDVVTNSIGALLGILIRSRWDIRSPELALTRRISLVAVILAATLAATVWTFSRDPFSTHGAASPGILEARWTFDERGASALDSSGNGLHGTLRGEPVYVTGVRGEAIQFDGARDYIDFGRAAAFRITRSMTITAWINSSSFPINDAAIVSSRTGDEAGYQLDTTVDRGPRTIGFKLINACGDTMARYGATPLAAGAWYHIAGVYDAEAKTIDVYLNGELDNGSLSGDVTGTQRSSRGRLNVAKRTGSGRFMFGGSIDDVRIYSMPLTNQEIAADMDGRIITGGEVRGAGGVRAAAHREHAAPECAISSQGKDARIPAIAATFGVLVAIACAGLYPLQGPARLASVSFASGFLLLPAASYTMPLMSLWMLPLLSLAGGASVACSLRKS